MKKDFEEISDLGFETSTISSLDQGVVDDDNDHDHDHASTLNSTLSGRSFAYYRTSSETSTFSEQLTDDVNSCSDTQSPISWPTTGRSPYRPALSRFGQMKPNHKFGMEDKLEIHEPMDLGQVLLSIAMQFVYRFYFQNHHKSFWNRTRDDERTIFKAFTRRRYVW